MYEYERSRISHVPKLNASALYFLICSNGHFSSGKKICFTSRCIFMLLYVLWFDWVAYLFFGNTFQALWFIQRMPIPCILKEPLNVFCECWIVFKNAHSQWFIKQIYLCCALFHRHFIGIHSVVLGRSGEYQGWKYSLSSEHKHGVQLPTAHCAL